jgi:hypothetical protein
MEGVRTRLDANKHMGKVAFIDRNRKEMRLVYGEGGEGGGKGETETIEAHPKVRFGDFSPGDHVRLRVRANKHAHTNTHTHTRKRINTCVCRHKCTHTHR